MGGAGRWGQRDFREHEQGGCGSNVPLMLADLRKYSTIRLRTKLNIAGLHSCKFFKAPENHPIDFKELDLRTCQIRPVIQLKGIWKQSNQWGLTLDCKKVLVDLQGTATWDF